MADNWYMIPVRFKEDHAHIVQVRYVLMARTPELASIRVNRVLQDKVPMLHRNLLEIGPIRQIATSHDYEMMPVLAISQQILDATDLESEER